MSSYVCQIIFENSTHSEYFVFLVLHVTGNINEAQIDEVTRQILQSLVRMDSHEPCISLTVLVFSRYSKDKVPFKTVSLVTSFIELVPQGPDI